MAIATKPIDYTAVAIERVKELARYMDENAAALVGDLSGVYIAEDGFRITCVIQPYDGVPTVEVSKNYIAIER